MEQDDLPSRADPMESDALLDRLIRQDLDPLSVAELEARVTVLEGEILRTRNKLERAVNHRASADALFRP